MRNKQFLHHDADVLRNIIHKKNNFNSSQNYDKIIGTQQAVK